MEVLTTPTRPSARDTRIDYVMYIPTVITYVLPHSIASLRIFVCGVNLISQQTARSGSGRLLSGSGRCFQFRLRWIRGRVFRASFVSPLTSESHYLYIILTPLGYNLSHLYPTLVVISISKVYPHSNQVPPRPPIVQCPSQRNRPRRPRAPRGAGLAERAICVG